MDFLEKLDLLLKQNNMNKNNLSKASGIPYTTIDGWYKKGYESMQLSTLKKLANYFNTSLDFWAKDETPNNVVNSLKFDKQEIKNITMYRKLDIYGKKVVNHVLEIEHERCTNQSKDENYKVPIKNKRIIPLSDFSLSAGTGNLLLDNTYEMIEIDGDEYPNADMAFRVKGDSMEPGYYDGDIVYIHRQPVVEPGEIGAFLYNDEQYLKKIVLEDGFYKLRSLNKKYEDIIIDNDSLMAYGKVLN